MPMRRNLGSVNAPEAHHERRSFGAWVAGHRRKVAALDDRRPLQITEVHTFGRRGLGAVFSHVVRGFGFGLAGSAAYIAARKGKDLDLPAQTGMLVRMDNAITLPVTGASNASLTSNSR